MRWLQGTLAVLALATCSAFAADAADAADAVDAGACPTGPVTIKGDRPVVGLVLSGGGARGAAHLGVLKVIEEEGIPVDLVVGTSMGSIVGALYASGMPVADIEKVVLDNDWNEVLADGPKFRDLSLFRKRETRNFQLGGRLGVGASGVKLPEGMRQGQNIRLLMRDITRHVATQTCFRNMALPYAAVATDVETGEAVVLQRGDIVDAMRASMAIPSYFTPVELDSRLLVDGGPANNMPVSIAREMGADVVIAIDIGSPLAKREKLKSLVGLTMQMSTMLARQVADRERKGLQPTDILIVPELATVQTLDFPEMKDAIADGEKAARVTLADSPLRGLMPAEQRPSARYAAEYAKTKQPATLGAVSFSGATRVAPEPQLRERFDLKPGVSIDKATIDAAIARVYGLDYYSQIDYARTPTPAGDDLELKLTERKTGPTYLQFGLGLYDPIEGLNRFSLGASFTSTQLNRLTGQAIVQARIGSTRRLYAELYQPLSRDANLFVAPWAVNDRHVIDIYKDGEPVARANAGGNELGFDTGWATRYSEWRVGYGYGERSIEMLVGPTTFPDIENQVGYLRFAGDFDSQDSRDFPSRGARFDWKVEQGDESLGTDGSFERFSVGGNVARQVGETGFLQLEARLESLEQRDGILLEPVRLGGVGELSAFVRDELMGDQGAYVRMAAWHQASRLKFAKVLVGGSLEYGGTWNGSLSGMSADDLYPVAALFAALSTPIGPIILIGGVSEDSHSALQFQLGAKF